MTAVWRTGLDARAEFAEWRRGSRMEAVPVKFVPRGYGETYRRDAWWVEPLVVFLVLGGFVVYATWAAFQNAHYTYGPYLSPFYSPEIWGDSHHAWFGPKPAWWPALAAVLAGAAHPAVPGPLPVHLLLLPRRVLQGVLVRPDRVLGRRAARHALPRRALVPAGAAERPPLLRLRGRAVPVRAVLRRVAGDVVRRTRPPGSRSSASAWARSSWRSTSCCSRATRWAATRSGTSSAATRTRCRSRRSRSACYGCSSALNNRHQLFAY